MPIKKSSISHYLKIQSKSCSLLSDNFSFAALEVLLDKGCRIRFNDKKLNSESFLK